MANERLIAHYESKYASAANNAATATLLVSRPRNRFEAAVAAVIPLLNGGDVLEIGAGDGRVSRGIAAAGGNFRRYVVTDLATVRAKHVADSCSDPRFEGYALDVEGDLSSLAGRSFQAIIMVALIEHLIDPIGVMRHIRSLLEPGGCVYLDTPNVAKYTRRLKLAAGYFPSTASLGEGLRTYEGKPVDLLDEGHLHYWTFRSMEKMLIEYCGFTRVEKAPYGNGLSRLMPTLFSDLAVVAYAS